jgi:hypothetical protein
LGDELRDSFRPAFFWVLAGCTSWAKDFGGRPLFLFGGASAGDELDEERRTWAASSFLGGRPRGRLVLWGTGFTNWIDELDFSTRLAS